MIKDEATLALIGKHIRNSKRSNISKSTVESKPRSVPSLMECDNNIHGGENKQRRLERSDAQSISSVFYSALKKSLT